jgi:enoyl-CoA hydratase/carnithine racemase
MLLPDFRSGDLTFTRIHDGSVAHVVLDRPRARNALSSDLVADLEQALRAVDADGSTRAVVLSGTSPGFCAGSDLKELADMTPDDMSIHEAETGRVVRLLQEIDIPVVAAVEGFAIGGGFLLATGCDVVVSADDARWHLPEVPLGWVPPWGVGTLLARVSPTVARRLVWGDISHTGAELHACGCVDEVTDPGDAVATATRIARRLADLPPSAVRSTKEAFRQAVLRNSEVLDQHTSDLFISDCESEQAQRSLKSYSSPREVVS